MLIQTRTTGRMIRNAALLALLGLLAAAPALAEESEFDYEAVGLRAAVWVDKSADEIYRKGEFQTVGFQASEDAYAVVYRIDSEGEVTVLWPRSRLDDGFIFGGHEYGLPMSGDRKLRVSTREGEGFVEAIVSRYPFDLRDLELDFHHEPGAERAGFRVAGDPYLAMNEVNFAITGLEDAGDYVVTNYVSYYVHQEVEHPRYLCNQCHFDDDTAYDPYRDSCQLNITIDHRWGNTWWDTYGYYPVYTSPVYVYTDPWLWRPWVNFWYDPWWRCPPVRGCYWPSTIYTWHDSDWYRGDCNVRYRDGHRRYRPLTPYDQARTKDREYGRTAPMLAEGKATKTGRGSRTSAYEGVKRTRRDNPAIARTVRDQGNGGLRIRDSYGRTSASSGVRHSAGGTRTAAGVKTTKRGDPGRRTVAPGRTSGTDRMDASRTRSGGSLRTVEPRNKGTRVWSGDRGTTSQQRQERSQQVRPGSSRRSGGRDATSTTRAKGNRSGTNRKSEGVRSGGGSSGGSRGSSKATVRSKSGGSRSSGKSTVRSKSGGSGSPRSSSKSTVRSGSKSGGSRDTSTKSSGSRSSGSSTRSGSSGGSSKSQGTRSSGSSSRGSGGRSGGRR
ncbi:MAG: DUF4384 domain-containing protein [bacterium]|nr:DUF4384 domain-containing protein [bacterium]